ncbi:MAG: DNA replication and repair protein RecF [Bacteroidales bacterium]|nr:DNA replication and repair protein RecF [Bacteroidales bacterium]
MYLKNLSLVNFKNYSQVELKLSPRINCFTGNNGSGKTNILDSIHYLCLCKSYFNPVDSQNIKYNNDFMIIQGNFDRQGNNEDIYCGVARSKKKIFKRNKKDYSRLSEHIGLLSLVMISPVDTGLILDGSEERRKFINSVISQYSKSYLQSIIKYNHILTQRNTLLKQMSDGKSGHEDTLEVYDKQMVTEGNKIYNERKLFIEKFVPIFQKYYEFISSGTEKVELTYNSQLNSGDFSGLLMKSAKKDRILQFSTVGVHKDDLELKLENHDIKKSGSQGQQKTYLVALKLAQYDFIKMVSGLNPLLLLDDIFDKFDEIRVRQIIELVAGENFGQIFITHTNLDRMKTVLEGIHIDYNLFFVEEDTIKQV